MRTNDDRDPLQEEHLKIKTSETVKSKFWSILESGATTMMSEAPPIWNGPDAANYEAEKRSINHCCRPLMYGVVSACLFFASFRVSANKSFQDWRQLYFGIRSHSHKLSKPEPKQQWKSYSERQYDERRQKLNESMSASSDFLISILLGCSVTGLNIRPSYLKKKFEDAPLLPGKSLSSKYLCNDMTDLFLQVDASVWSNKENNSVLDTLANFTENCQRRNNIEKRIRQEKNLPKDQDVSIPYSQYD
mmetsp:Transcript_25650/g.37900  ORF Transcript_25650/g.37900 Transcript_25650/m.37900 type:complete len:247 (+) Transcript_25650:55-795(+)